MTEKADSLGATHICECGIECYHEVCVCVICGESFPFKVGAVVPAPEFTSGGADSLGEARTPEQLANMIYELFNTRFDSTRCNSDGIKPDLAKLLADYALSVQRQTRAEFQKIRQIIAMSSDPYKALGGIDEIAKAALRRRMVEENRSPSRK